MTHKYLGSLIIEPSNHVFEKMVANFDIKAIFAAIVAFSTYVIYEDSVALAVLLIFVAVDWLTGCWAALKNHTFNSNRFRATIIKLLIYMVLISLFHSLERIVSIVSYFKLDMFVAGYLACTEVISILENFTRISKIKGLSCFSGCRNLETRT